MKQHELIVKISIIELLNEFSRKTLKVKLYQFNIRIVYIVRLFIFNSKSDSTV